MHLFQFLIVTSVSFRNAAEAAGFNVLRLIHEPAAALLAYDIGQESPSGKRCVLGKEHLRFHYGHWFQTDVVGVYPSLHELSWI